MAFQMITAASVGVGPRVYLASDGDGAFVASGVLVVSNDDVAILGEVGNLHLILDGTVATGGVAAVHLGDSAVFDTNHTVFVGRTGVVRGPFTALYIEGHDSQVTNYGDIGGGAVGITLSGQGAGQTRVVNHGLISADTGIKRSVASDSEGISLLNMGVLEGRIWAYDGLLSDTTDTITNRGAIFGDVRLGGGVDVFDTRGAGEVVGKVFGGAGDDRFLLGAAEDVIDGGTGIDTIDATASGAIILALDASVAGSGRTLGDTLTGIETILGSRLGGDQLFGTTGAQTVVGQGGADRLEGRAGNDTLLGGDGNDRLVGEAGVDALTGGAGDDRFVFRLVTEAGDMITDFAGATGNNDAVEVAIAGFGAGLVRGVLAATQFQVRSTNAALDADDRFIFRTSDATLWFDRNGNGEGGLTMLADLQAEAVVTAGDILLV